MNFSSLCAKGLGALTAGLVLYDAHKNGTINGIAEGFGNFLTNGVIYFAGGRLGILYSKARDVLAQREEDLL